MSDRARLEGLLRRLDGGPYPAYRDLEGRWDLDGLELIVDRVQGDPFATPSRVRLRVPTDLPAEVLARGPARRAAEDWLLRRFGEGLRGTDRGSGRSGALEVYRPGPAVVERSALRLDDDGVAEVRFRIGLPARGRRILGRQAAGLLFDDVPAAAARLRVGPGLSEQVRSVVRQGALRAGLRPAGLVAFVEDGSVLPRASGVSRAPLEGAVPFAAPDALAVTLETPLGPARGLGIRRGVTLITGGGFHGKSTLLDAIARGVLDHVPGDGREGVVTDPDAVVVRAEDGRSVRGVDISPFLSDLPGGRTTAPFDTDDASGSTSQAAAIVEAVEGGARLLLLDEDTSATNLLVRDARMAALIPPDREPITPFVGRVRQLVDDWGVSTVMVVGGVGDYLAVADAVIGMDAFHAVDLTARAHALAGDRPTPPGPLGAVTPRVVAPDGLAARKIRARSARAVDLDREELDLTGVHGVDDAPRAVTLGRALRFLADAGLVDGRRDLARALDALDAILDDEGVEALGGEGPPGGWLVRPRRHEVLAAMSRWRRLRVQPAR